MIEQDRELVLSVSGSPLMRRHLEEGLSRGSRSVLSFPNVEEGARAARQKRIDVVLCCADELEGPADGGCRELWDVSTQWTDTALQPSLFL